MLPAIRGRNTTIGVIGANAPAEFALVVAELAVGLEIADVFEANPATLPGEIPVFVASLGFLVLPNVPIRISRNMLWGFKLDFAFLQWQVPPGEVPESVGAVSHGVVA